MTYTSTRGFGQQQKTIAPQSVLAELSQLPVPEAVEDEYGILSCIFNSYDAQAAFCEAANLLKPQHFLTPTLHQIWEGMLEAHKKNLPAEFRVQANYLQDFANVASDTLKGVLDHISTSLHDPEQITHYAERIVRKAESREILNALANSARAALDSSVSPEDALMEAEHNLRSVRESLTTKSVRRTGTTKELGGSIIEHLEQIALGNRSADVIKTNMWYELDQLGRGGRPGEIIMFAAPPGGGKTTTAANLANALSSQGIFTLWVSLEDSPEACYAKILATEAKMSISTIVDGADVGISDVHKLRAVQEKLQNNTLVCVQPLTMTIEGVEQSIAQAESDMAKEYGDKFTGFRAIIFDYIQYLGKFVDAAVKTSYIDSLTARLGHIADKMNATLYAFAQYDTETIKNGRRPEGLGILADCKAVVQTVDQLWCIWSEGYAKREDLHNNSTLEYICLKNRRGSTGAIKLGIKWEYGWIYSLLGSDGKGMEYPSDPAQTKLPRTEEQKQLPEATAPEVVPDEDFEDEDFSAKYNDPDLEVVALPKPLEPLKTVEVVPEVPLVLEPAIEVIQEVVEPELSVELPPIAEMTEGAIVVGDVKYEVGEEVTFLGYKRNSTARLLGWDGEELKIEHLESIPDPNPEGSGKQYLRHTGKIESVNTSRIAKIPRD